MRTEQSKPIFENFVLSQKEALEFRNKPTTSNAKKAVFLLCSTDLNVKMSHKPIPFHSSFISAWNRYGIFVFQSLTVNQWQKQGNNPELLTPSHMTLVLCPWNCILSFNNLHEMNWVCDFKYQSTTFPKLIDWIVLIVSFQSLLFFLYCPDRNGKQRPQPRVKLDMMWKLCKWTPLGKKLQPFLLTWGSTSLCITKKKLNKLKTLLAGLYLSCGRLFELSSTRSWP